MEPIIQISYPLKTMKKTMKKKKATKRTNSRLSDLKVGGEGEE